MNDFDFLVGSWDVANRRLTKRLAGSAEWEQFPAIAECVRLFDGAANLDEIRFPTRGFSGALGTGLLRGRREDLGDQLDHGVHPAMTCSASDRYPATQVGARMATSS